MILVPYVSFIFILHSTYSLSNYVTESYLVQRKLQEVYISKWVNYFSAGKENWRTICWGNITISESFNFHYIPSSQSNKHSLRQNMLLWPHWRDLKPCTWSLCEQNYITGKTKCSDLYPCLPSPSTFCWGFLHQQVWNHLFLPLLSLLSYPLSSSGYSHQQVFQILRVGSSLLLALIYEIIKGF